MFPMNPIATLEGRTEEKEREEEKEKGGKKGRKEGGKEKSSKQFTNTVPDYILPALNVVGIGENYR